MKILARCVALFMTIVRQQLAPLWASLVVWKPIGWTTKAKDISILQVDTLIAQCLILNRLAKKQSSLQNMVNQLFIEFFSNFSILGMPFPADFEQQCRRIIRLLWHCCGHLYTKWVLLFILLSLIKRLHFNFFFWFFELNLINFIFRHWDLMAILNLRPQYGLVLAHLASISKIYMLLDSKELNSLTNTLSLVRPSCLQAPPAKRFGFGGEQFSTSTDSSVTVNPNTTFVNFNRVSKSGSWGGQSQSTASSSTITSMTISTMPALTNNNMGKNALIHNNSAFAAQTC